MCPVSPSCAGRRTAAVSSCRIAARRPRGANSTAYTKRQPNVTWPPRRLCFPSYPSVALAAAVAAARCSVPPGHCRKPLFTDLGEWLLSFQNHRNKFQARLVAGRGGSSIANGSNGPIFLLRLQGSGRCMVGGVEVEGGGHFGGGGVGWVVPQTPGAEGSSPEHGYPGMGVFVCVLSVAFFCC